MNVFMKNLLIVLLSILVIFGVSFNARAGFIIKSHPVAIGSSNIRSINTVVNKKHSSFFSRLYPYKYTYHSRQAWIGFWFAIGGLLFQPLGFLAIMHGAWSLKRSKLERGLATADIVIGSLEMLLMILYVILFFAFIVVL